MSDKNDIHNIKEFRLYDEVIIVSGCNEIIINTTGMIVGYSSIDENKALYIVWLGDEKQRPNGSSSHIHIQSYHLKKYSSKDINEQKMDKTLN